MTKSKTDRYVLIERETEKEAKKKIRTRQRQIERNGNTTPKKRSLKSNEPISIDKLTKKKIKHTRTHATTA